MINLPFVIIRSLPAARCSIVVVALVFSTMSSKAAEFPQEFRGSWRFLPSSNSDCAVKITDKRVEYSDAGCVVVSTRKENDKFKIRLKCRFIDEGEDWVASEEWGLLTRDERKRFLVLDRGSDFDVLERCQGQN